MPFSGAFMATEPWLFGSPSPWGCLTPAEPPGRAGPSLCVCGCRGVGGTRGVGSRLSAPSLQLGEGVLPSSSLQSHYMRDQVCAVPDLCTAASAGSSGELSAFSYLPVWLTMQYMKLWSIELGYLKGWGFFPISSSVFVSVGENV